MIWPHGSFKPPFARPRLLHVHFDRVSHTLKAYLGRRFGFDGLESTTSEIISHLQQSREALAALPGVHDFLRETDLVKFAGAGILETDAADLVVHDDIGDVLEVFLP